MDIASQAALIRAALPSSDTPTFGGHKPMRLPDRYLQHEKARLVGTTTKTGSDSVERSHREFKYLYPEPDTASSSDSEGVIEPPRYARRAEDDRLRERDVYFERSRRRSEGLRAFHMEDRSSTLQSSYGMSARDYIERSGGRTRQYQESARRPSPQRASSKDEVEYIKRSEGWSGVMVRRGSGSSRSSPLSQKPALRAKRSFMHSDSVLDNGLSPQIYPTMSPSVHPQPRSAGPNPEEPRREPPRRGSPRDDRERRRRLSIDYDDWQLPPMRPDDTMPVHVNSVRKRETSSSRKAQKSSGLRKTEWTDESPTPTPEPVLPSDSMKYPFQREYAYDHELATRTIRRTGEGVYTKQHNGGALSSRYTSTQQRPPLVYTAQGLRDTPLARLSLERKEAMPRSSGLLVSHTVSRDDTSSEDAKASSLLRTAMEPHMSYLES